ncbi:GumC domain-containing protein [Gluconacetobacter sacchari]|nr:hypothetical protein [Gluconacetobacter sacchari]
MRLLAQMAARLNAAEDKLVAFSLAHKISDLGQQTTIILRRLGDLSDQLTTNASEVDDFDGQIRTLDSALRLTPSQVELFSETDIGQARKTMQERLARLQIQLADARQRYKDTFPLVVDIEHQISDIKQQIAQATPRETNVKRNGVNTVYDALNQQRILLSSRAAGLRAKRVAIEAEKNALQARLAELTSLSGQYRDLQTARDSLTESYRTLETNVGVSTMGSTLAQVASTNIRVVHPPNASMHGTTLRLPIMATGLMFGMIAAVGVLAFRVSTQKIFVTVRDVELGLHLPVLLSIPLYKSNE